MFKSEVRIDRESLDPIRDARRRLVLEAAGHVQLAETAAQTADSYLQNLPNTEGRIASSVSRAVPAFNPAAPLMSQSVEIPQQQGLQ